VIIRNFLSADYPRLIGVHNTIFPDRQATVESWIAQDRQRDPKCKHQRYVALIADRCIGFGEFTQHIFNYHPRKFTVSVLVLSPFRNRGIGSALYEQLNAGLRPFQPKVLRADIYGDQSPGISFLVKRGFKEVFRETPLHLEVRSFNPAPFEGLPAKLQAQGIAIKSLRDLAEDPLRDRRVYDLFWEGTQAVPHEGDIAIMDFPEWTKWTLQDPTVPHEGYFIAVHQDEYLGISEFGINPADHSLQAGLVYVKQAFRQRGVALAMQLTAIAHAKRKGFKRIKTSTSIDNQPMRSLYERLGFLRQPDWLQFEKCIPDK
jgi:GNAT superfamily N-acetyltransferase